MAGYKPTVLLVSEGYDNPTLNRQVAQIPVGAGAKVYSTVLQASREEREKAQRDGVQLILPEQPRGDPRPPTLDWLTYDHRIRYPDLPENVNCIVGHADITDTAARNIKDDRYPHADLIMFTHVIPEDTEYYKGGRKAMKAKEKENDMLHKVDKAKAAFSVGKQIFDHFSTKYKGRKKPQSHHIFLPKPPELFLATDVRPGGEQKVVLSIGRVRKVEKLKGHDLVGESMREVVKIIKNTRWCARAISEDDFETSQKILEDALNSPDLNPTLMPYGTQEDIRDDMMTAHLVLMPSRSEPFGLVGLEAIAAGIPVLISDKTGLADMITDLIDEGKLSAEHRYVIVETSVSDRNRAGDAERWAKRIVDILQHSDSEFEKAARLKRELLESRYWEESHNAFLQACGVTGEVPVEVLLRGHEVASLYAAACRQGSLPVYSTRVPVVGQYRSGKSCFIKRLMGETVSGEEEEPITDGINIISDVQSKTWKKSKGTPNVCSFRIERRVFVVGYDINKIQHGIFRITLGPSPPADRISLRPSGDPIRGRAGTSEEIDDLAAPLLRTQRNTSAGSSTGPSVEPSAEDGTKQQEMSTSPAQQESNEGPIQTSKGQNSKPDLPREEQTKPKPPEIPEYLREYTERMLNAGITKEDLGTAEHPRLSFWDFGGQATYYGTHHCFITHRGVYILVMSLEQKLSEDVPKEDSRASVDNLKTGGDYLDHWLNTVHSHTLQHETRDPEGSQDAGQSGPQSSSQDKTPRGTGRPPVIIVLTHKDKVSQEDIEKYKEEIWSHIEGKAAGKLVMPDIFAVDNTTEDAAVDEIRDYIRQVARGLPHMGEKIPIPWLHLKSRLRKKREEGPFVKFHEVTKLARDPDINITDEHNLAKVLTFLHDRGDVIFFDEPSLRDDVTLQPQVLIDVFKTIITVREYQQGRETDQRQRWGRSETKVGKMWERLEKEGVLSDELLTRLWEEKDRQLEKPFLMYPDVIKMFETWLEQEGVLSNKQHELTRIWEKRSHQLQKPFLLQHKSFLKVLMEKFYLICNATPVGDANDEAQQEELFFVPALLSCKRNNARLYPSNMHKCPEALYFVFSEQFLPSGIFSRLQALCVRRFGLQESCVFAGCARFPADDKEQSFVITKVNHYLKVELLSSNVLKFTEGLRVRKFLSSALFEIKEKWIPCIQYELCCSTQQENGSEPAFRALRTDDDEPSSLALPTSEGSSGQRLEIPSSFRDVWMKEFERSQPHRTEDYEGGGLAMEDLHSIVRMCNIGPVLDTLNLGGVLTLEQCDQVRSQETPKQRRDELLRLVENRYVLGAAVEMCFPEFVHPSLMEKRGKELVILHANDCTEEFVLPIQTAVDESGLSCQRKVITRTDSITEKTVELLLNTNNRMVALVISPRTLHDRHWPNLDYEFPVRNEKLLLLILLYEKGSRDETFKKLKQRQRSSVLYDLPREEIQMKEGEVSDVKLQRIIQQVMTDDKKGCKVPIVLLINDEYGTSKGGISTINCQASQTLKGKAVVYATVLQMKVPKQDQEAADSDDVTLIRPVQLDKKTEPTLDWLSYYHREHFPNLPKNVTCIIGHADITDTAARNIKDQRYPHADHIMFTHVLPENTEYYKGEKKPVDAEEKENDMLDQVDNAKAAFSVGQLIYKHFIPKYRYKKPRKHHLFFPRPSNMFEEATIQPDSGEGELVVLCIGRVKNVENLKGYNLAARAIRIVAQYLKYLRWITRGISEDDWEESLKILEDALNSPYLKPTLRQYGTQEDIKKDMMMAHLVLMPSRSEPFGLVGLEAIAAGIPVLISDKTGLARMIEKLVAEEKLPRGLLNRIVKTSVRDSDMDKTAEKWADKIRETLTDTKTAFEQAKEFKAALLESKYWEDSEREFLRACGITDTRSGQSSPSSAE
ncbi:hypothetical protein Bbelb_249060 [Branchiostoma belcheri]|nr:hypothetical protein Bbelb_249060 [Branchiostoma belcheri]